MFHCHSCDKTYRDAETFYIQLCCFIRRLHHATKQKLNNLLFLFSTAFNAVFGSRITAYGQIVGCRRNREDYFLL